MIKCIQFEYNNNWAAAGFTLENIFNKLTSIGFRFNRLTIWGQFPVRKFGQSLENYKHCNYIVIS